MKIRKREDGQNAELIDKDEPKLIDERTLRFTATTDSEDRDEDVIVPEGLKTESFKKNPVFLWSHNAHQLPIGKVVRVERKDGEFIIDVKFDNDPFADAVFQKYKNGFLNAVSIGFRPIDHEEREEGKGLKFVESELLEVSAVTVQSNREALVHRAKEELTKKFKGGPDFYIQDTEKLADDIYQVVKSSLENDQSEDNENEEPEEPEQKDTFEKAVTEFQDFPVVEREDWDGDASELMIREHTSSDGSGDKETIDWEAYQRMHLIYNGDVSLDGGEPRPDFEDFKMPYVEIEEGDPVVPDAVIPVINSILEGGLGGVDEFSGGDVEQAKEHWEKYNQKIGETAPWNQEDDSRDGSEKVSRELEIKVNVDFDKEQVKEAFNDVLDEIYREKKSESEETKDTEDSEEFLIELGEFDESEDVELTI